MPTIDDYLHVCEQAARTGGQVVQHWLGRTDVREKGPADLVTQADFASQEAVRQTVLTAFPTHCLLGEENPAASADPQTQGQTAQPLAFGEDVKTGAACPGRDTNQTSKSAEYRWIVDPLDGTTNFVHGIPHYCVSLALERRGELLVGAVFDPTRNECFTAAAGQGSRLNGQPIRVSNISDLSEAVAAVDFPPNVQRDAPDLRLFLRILDRCQAIRRTGSSALNLCYLAAGRFDLFWSYSTKVWDVAAGVLIVREAGGIVTSPTGGAFVLDEAHFLAAANPQLHTQLRETADSLG